MGKLIDGIITVYDAYDEMDENGKFDSYISKLKSFKEYINGDTFEHL